MNLEHIKYIVVPDVHGRTFWKTPVKDALEHGVKVIFLGDYLDPYPNEYIYKRETIDIFKEILQLKKDHPDDITLLIGNHDEHYINNKMFGVRMDYVNKLEISSLFNDNIDLFEYLKIESIGNKNVIFSHAGITNEWIVYNLELLLGDETQNVISDIIVDFDLIKKIRWNDLFHNKTFLNKIGMASVYRGGDEQRGSFLWADLSEHVFGDDISGCIQIFGHTQQESSPVMSDNNLYCLDCRKVFYVTDNGDVVDSEFSELSDNVEEIRSNYEKLFKSYFAIF